MADYAPDAAEAAAMIAEYGGAATLTRPAVAASEWGTGGSAAAQTSPAVAVVFDYRQELLDGVVRKPGDKEMYLGAAGLTFAPLAGDTVTHGGLVWRIEAINTLAPDGVTAILHTCQVRRAS